MARFPSLPRPAVRVRGTFAPDAHSLQGEPVKSRRPHSRKRRPTATSAWLRLAERGETLYRIILFAKATRAVELTEGLDLWRWAASLSSQQVLEFDRKAQRWEEDHRLGAMAKREITALENLPPITEAIQ